MAIRKSRKSTGTRRSSSKSGSVASRLPKPTPAQVEGAKRKFEQGVMKRAEAVREGEALPSGATHEIAGADETGKPALRRKRFSLS
jgi:hypothetical protein